MHTTPTTQKTFEHTPINLGYDDLLAESGSSGRTYNTPDGNKYPSITTVLSILSIDSIMAWRKRVGDEEANKISTRASRRGTSLHLIAEKYINNDPDYKKKFTPDIIETFNTIKPILDTRIGKVYGQELPLYSNYLKVAGRVDCIAEFDGVPSIIDFKTSRRVKKAEDITSYYMQEAAYAIMWEERTQQPIVNLVTIMAVDDNPPIVFKEHRDNWVKPLIETISTYYDRRNNNV
jgi:genome maintenance exonuclease 1